MFDLTMNDGQKVSLGVSPTDADGRAIPVVGVPTWTSSDPNIVTLQVADDGLSAVALSGPAPGQGTFGTATISFAGTTAVGDIPDSGTITVIPKTPVAANLTPGTPVDE